MVSDLSVKKGMVKDNKIPGNYRSREENKVIGLLTWADRSSYC